MATRTFEQKTDNVYLWKEICELHWERLLGEFWGDEQFWSDLFHSMEHQDWEDVLAVGKAIQVAHPEELRSFPKFSMNMEILEKRLNKLDPAIKPYNRQGYNTPAVSVFMAIRDILNEINGTPTRRWTDKDKARIQANKETNKFSDFFHTGD